MVDTATGSATSATSKIAVLFASCGGEEVGDSPVGFQFVQQFLVVLSAFVSRAGIDGGRAAGMRLG